MRILDTKQIHWTYAHNYDERNQGCFDSMNEVNDDTVTAPHGGTDNDMTVQRNCTSQKNVTEKGYSVVNEETVTTNSGGAIIKMTTQRSSTSTKNVTVEGCVMANKNKVTVLVCAKTNGHINGHIGPENVFETYLAIDVTMGPSYWMRLTFLTPCQKERVTHVLRT